MEEDDGMEGEYEEVVEGGYSTSTYCSFLNRTISPAWGLEETRRFYQVNVAYFTAIYDYGAE